jgi:acyl dehydratase
MIGKVFTDRDQTFFAALSGDWNPMHMDPVAARRTQAGLPAVHGIHGLLWALENTPSNALGGSGALQAMR